MSNHNALQIDRLLRFWPQSALSDEAMTAYGECISRQHPDDVRRAVDAFVLGKLDRNHGFIPPPGELSAQITKARNARLDEEARNAPRLMPPPIAKHSPEEMEQRRAFVADVVGRFKRDNAMVRLEAMKRDQSPEQIKREAERMARQSLLDAAVAGDADALAKLQADNRTLALSPASLASLNLKQERAA